MNNLARVLFDQKKYKEAYFLFNRKLTLLPNHVGTVITLNNLAAVFCNLNQLEDA